MLIDWFTVAAEALNFFILIWLLKRVLYKPIMAAIDAREVLVAAQLNDAAAKRIAADEARQEFNTKNAVFDRDRAAQLAKAVEEAKSQGAQLLEASRAVADALQIERRDALQQEVRELREAFAQRVEKAFFALARRAFMDLANQSLEAQVTDLFCKRLRSLHGDAKTVLCKAIQTSSAPTVLRSAFPLGPNLQAAVKKVVDETFDRKIPLRFEIAPELISGIEVTAQGQRAGWSITEYMAVFERSVSDTLPCAARAT